MGRYSFSHSYLVPTKYRLMLLRDKTLLVPMGKFTKQLVSTVVTLSTVLSSVGLGAFAVPSMASAATLMNGDLIKASGPAVYYYSNGRRFVFPNEATYRSWFADFSGVRTITDSELAAIMIGGNVTMRPGTSLVKITTDPRVYAVTRGGVLHWVESEQIAIALYGSNWARRVVDVPDQLFVNYSIGSSVSTAVHPDGSLVSYSGSSDRYVVVNGMRRRVTDAGFSANMFQATHVIPTTINYSNGADVVAREAELADAVVTSGSPTTPVSGSLTVSLASDTSPSMVLPKNAQNVMFTKVNLMAGSSGATVSSMRFRRVGVGSTSDFSNVYLYKADGTRLTSGRTISSTDNSVTFSGLNLTLGAGATQAVYISADLSGTPSNTSFQTGGQHLFELADMSSVTLSGTGSVAGNFPIRGNAMTVGTASVATVTVLDGSEPADPRTGTQDAELANFRLALSGTNADVEVRRVTLYQTGTISNSDLGNLRLFQGADQVATASSIGSDGKIVLNFTTPFVIPNGQTRTFNLRGSVAGRSARTIRIYTEYSSDVYAIDRTYSVGAAVDIDGEGVTTSNRYDGTGTDGTGASFSTVQGGQFTITYNGPATANVAKSQNDVVFYKFAITSGSNDVEIRKFNFAVTTTGVGIYDGTTEYLRDIKIKDADTGETVVSPVSCTSACASPGYRAFDSGSVSVLVRAGQTRNFVITADTSSSITGTPTYVFALGGASGNKIFGSTDLRVVDSGEFLTSGIAPETTVTGNTMTVQPASFNVTLAGTPSSGVAVKNQADIRSAAFTINAGSQNAIRVSSFKVTGKGDVTGSFLAADLDQVVNSCGLFDGETQVGSRQSPNATTGAMTFSGLSLTVPRGSGKTLEVRCTADSSVTQTGGDKFSVGIAALETDITAQDEEGNTVTHAAGSLNTTPTISQTVRASGSLTIASNNQRPSTILIADNETWQTLSRYRADALYEDVTIDYMGVSSTGPSASVRDVAIVQSADADCASYTVRGTKSLNSGSNQTDEVDLSSNPIVVAKGSTSYICLMARLASTVPSSTNADVSIAPRSGNTIALGIPSGALTVGGAASTIFTSALYTGNVAVRATGSASGERVYQSTATLDGNTFVIRKAKPVVTRTQGLSTTLSAGEKTLYSAQIGAQGGSVAVKQLVFKVTAATTSNMTLSNFRLSRGGSDVNLSDIAIQDTYGTDLETTSVPVWETTTSTFHVIVRFTNEEVVSGSGATYALRATVGGLNSTTGDSITTSLLQADSLSNVTGYLVTGTSQLTAGSIGAGVVGLETTGNISTTSDIAGRAMLWSDLSEVPHSSSATASQSRDWTDEYLVDTISGSQVLNK